MSPHSDPWGGAGSLWRCRVETYAFVPDPGDDGGSGHVGRGVRPSTGGRPTNAGVRLVREPGEGLGLGLLVLPPYPAVLGAGLLRGHVRRRSGRRRRPLAADAVLRLVR